MQNANENLRSAYMRPCATIYNTNRLSLLQARSRAPTTHTRTHAYTHACTHMADITMRSIEMAVVTADRMQQHCLHGSTDGHWNIAQTPTSVHDNVSLTTLNKLHCLQTRRRTVTRTHTRAHTHARTQTYMHTNIHACLHACIHYIMNV